MNITATHLKPHNAGLAGLHVGVKVKPLSNGAG